MIILYIYMGVFVYWCTTQLIHYSCNANGLAPLILITFSYRFGIENGIHMFLELVSTLYIC